MILFISALAAGLSAKPELRFAARSGELEAGAPEIDPDVPREGLAGIADAS